MKKLSEQKKERPVMVWLFTILVLIYIIWGLIGINFLYPMFKLNLIRIILGSIYLIPLIITTYKIFMLERKALTWAHLTLGTYLGIFILNTILFNLSLLAP